MLSLGLAAAFIPDPSGTLPASAAPGDHIGRYRLLELIGEGGFGNVWMAEQQEPVRREVALKIIKLGMDTKEVVARFEAERQALARMDHPNIARVFDGGATERGRPYFVMELVKGVRITDYCDAKKLSTEERLKLFMDVCQAVQHAHQKGVIHRDLKPSNVLVTELDGKAVPKVIDFGIAKATEQKLSEQTFFTRFNQVIGSPAYMSPEQAGLGSLDVDTRSDIYSLGVLLYELLTGRTPFSNEELLKAGLDGVGRLIREKEPPKPSTQLSTLANEELVATAAQRSSLPAKLNRLLRGDLDWIVMKALEKDRNRRYETANGFARDIGRFLNQEPVTAAAPGLGYRFRKFSRRNRLGLAIAGAFAGIIVLASIISTRQAVRATRHARAEEQLRKVAQSNEFILRNTVYAADMTLAAQALERGDDETARQTLRQYFPAASQPDLRGWEWRHLWHRAQGDPSRALSGHSNVITAVAFLPGGQRLFSSSHDGTIREWDFASGRQLRIWAFPTNRWSAFAIHPSGTNLVALDDNNGLAALVDLRSGDRRTTPVSLQRNCYAAQASPDGLGYVHGAGGWGFSSTNGRTVVRDADFGSPRGLPFSGSRSAFAPDGKLLATGSWLDRIKLWSWPELQPAGELGPVSAVTSLNFSPDGRRLIAGGKAGSLSLWEVPSRRLIRRTEAHTRTTVGSVEFSPDGRQIATAGGDQTLVIWDAERLEPIRILRGYTDHVRQVKWTADGQELVSTTLGAGIRVWPMNPMPYPKPVGVSVATPVHFSSDSRLLAVELTEPPGASIWSLSEGREIGRIHATNNVRGFLPGNELIVLEDRGRSLVELRRVPTFELVRSIPLEPAPTNSIGGMCRLLSPDGRLLVQCRESGFISVWDLETGRLREHFEAHKGGVRKAIFSRDGRWLLSCGADRAARLWDAARFQQAMTYQGGSGTSWEVAFSADGQLVAVGWMDSSFRVFDRASGQMRAVFQTRDAGLAVLAGPGPTLVTVDANQSQIRFWNLLSQREAGTISFKGSAGQFLALSPDETTLVTEAQDRTLLFWRAPVSDIE
jgi:WD40 repeat protein